MQTKTYTPQFRAEAVKLVLAQGLSLEEAARRIAMPKGTLANWVITDKRGNAGTVMPGSRTVPELEAEVARLRKELANPHGTRRRKKGGRVLCSGVAARYAFMKSLRLDYPMGLLCRACRRTSA
jgi:transposase